MSRVATLRASGRRLQAEVVLGVQDNGSQVTVKVDLDRSDEVHEALAPLENLVMRVAEERTGQAKNNAAIQAGIDARLPKAVKAEKERLARNVDREVEKRVEAAKRDREDAVNARLQAERRLASAQADFEDHSRSLSRQLSEAREQVDRLQQRQAVGE